MAHEISRMDKVIPKSIQALEIIGFLRHEQKTDNPYIYRWDPYTDEHELVPLKIKTYNTKTEIRLLLIEYKKALKIDSQAKLYYKSVSYEYDIDTGGKRLVITGAVK